MTMEDESVYDGGGEAPGDDVLVPLPRRPRGPLFEDDDDGGDEATATTLAETAADGGCCDGGDDDAFSVDLGVDSLPGLSVSSASGDGTTDDVPPAPAPPVVSGSTGSKRRRVPCDRVGSLPSFRPRPRFLYILKLGPQSGSVHVESDGVDCGIPVRCAGEFCCLSRLLSRLDMEGVVATYLNVLDVSVFEDPEHPEYEESGGGTLSEIYDVLSRDHAACSPGVCTSGGDPVRCPGPSLSLDSTFGHVLMMAPSDGVSAEVFVGISRGCCGGGVTSLQDRVDGDVGLLSTFCYAGHTVYSGEEDESTGRYVWFSTHHPESPFRWDVL